MQHNTVINIVVINPNRTSNTKFVIAKSYSIHRMISQYEQVFYQIL